MYKFYDGLQDMIVNIATSLEENGELVYMYLDRLVEEYHRFQSSTMIDNGFVEYVGIQPFYTVHVNVQSNSISL